ncbi:MAG TPA: hypothetical protein VN805_04695 [Caulobacteraceae bacterium]|nr:hypothetical protein [Caulobacteraceae bacterium]
MAVVGSVRFRVAPGKSAEATAYLGRLAAHLKSVNGNDYRVLTQLAGPVGHLMIASTWDNIAAWDAARLKNAADAGFQKMAGDAAAAELWVPGTTESALWQDV